MIKPKQKKLLIAALASITLVVLTYLAWPNSTIEIKESALNNSESQAVKPSFDKSQFALDEASSLWVVANKGNQLPSTYKPAKLVEPKVLLGKSKGAEEMQLRSDAAIALEEMFSTAEKDGIKLILVSGFRSYALQRAVYGNYSAAYGTEKADTFSARPGHSEHQTGLAADVGAQSRHCELDICFKDTPEGRWVAENSQNFGFIIRYQQNTQELTGYQFEPWHLRYLGHDLAEQVRTSNQTLEEFFGLKIYKTYPSNINEIKNR
jgi:D-alanyl-D-alanine carboxypeptidase